MEKRIVTATMVVALVAVVAIPLIGTSASAITANLYGNDVPGSGYYDQNGVSGVNCAAQWFGDRYGSATEESVIVSHPTFEPNEPPIGSTITAVGFRYRLWKSKNHVTVTYTAKVYASGVSWASTIAGPALGSIQWDQNTSDQAWYDKWIPLTTPQTWKQYNLDPNDASTQGYWWVVSAIANPAGEFHTSALTTGVWGNRGYQSGNFKDWRNQTLVEYTIPEPGSILAIGTGLLGLAGFAIRRKR